jgi:RNA polymerase sigma-70 factor (ECF subfamily)
MKDLEDQILVQRALQADSESFGELCRRYYPSLLAVADSVLLDHHAAEDAAQDALTEACRKLPELRKPERFGAWIGAICRNVARDMLGQQKRRPIQLAAERRNDCPDDERKAALDNAIGQLPQHLREVIFLRFYNEMSYEQMASVLGATEQAIDGRLRRAKKKIAVYLKRKGLGR